VNTLVIFARAPRRGMVKSRLAAGVGPDAALAAYRELGALAVRATRSLPHVRRVIAVTPDDGIAETRAWLGAAGVFTPQGDGDLGARMHRAIAAACAAGAPKVVVIGTDCPECSGAVVARAFRALDRCDAVFGPATDGGYYLVGVTRPQPALFTGIPWSTADTLRASLAAGRHAGLSLDLLDILRDIDTADDWAWWQARRAAH
jgi:hypothetical protein